ncbi:MAG: hypothetical protein PVI40_06800 [Chlamydiota bacterium]|jgi:hypothetical protein
MEAKISQTRLFDVDNLSKQHPGFSAQTLRHLIAESKSNGFDAVIKRIGKRKIVLDESAFLKWVELQQGGAK